MRENVTAAAKTTSKQCLFTCKKGFDGCYRGNVAEGMQITSLHDLYLKNFLARFRGIQCKRSFIYTLKNVINLKGNHCVEESNALTTKQYIRNE